MSVFISKIEIDQRTRLFQQLHQDDNPDWFRAAGGCLCPLCGLEYRKHPQEEEYNIDHRLCTGELVHL